MKSFLSLMLVLVMILVVPAVITSCTKAVAQTGATTVQTDSTAVANDSGSTAVAPDSGNVLTQIFSSTDVFSWQNILVVVLGILSTIFATLWKRARNAITAIDEALSNDGKIDKAELTKIIAAWKG